MVFDLTDRASFERLRFWMTIILKDSAKDAVFVLVGNKADKINAREVSWDYGNEFANEFNMIYIETSAKGNQGIDLIFEISVAQENLRQDKENF